MATQSEIKARVKALFLKDISVDAVTTVASDLSGAPDSTQVPQRRFSAFDPADQERQAELLFAVMEAFGNSGDANSGIEAAMELLEEASRSGDLMMAQHVLGIFAAHAPKIRSDSTSIPVPPIVFAVPVDDGADLMSSLADEVDEVSGEPLSGEGLLHWFREDIHLNEHHRHWHMVYTTSGVPSGPPTSPSFPVRMKSRQGEVFVYMHKQMLARYETERITAGLPGVTSFSDFSQSLGTGYDPDEREPKSLNYAARPDDVHIGREQQLDLENRREAFRIFLQTGRVAGMDVPLTATTVGTVLESNRALLSNAFNDMSEYREAGSIVNNLHLHNVGHGVIAASGDPGAGVMTNPHTSLQDPVFWRWHKMIDNLAEQYYATLPIHEFTANDIQLQSQSSNTPPIAIFCESESKNIDFSTEDRDALRQQVIENAEAVFSHGESDSGILRTGIFKEQFKYLGRFHGPNIADRIFNRDTLFSERFALAVRATSAVSTAATARIFICDDAFLDLDPTIPDGPRRLIRSTEHRNWIELDRQPVQLEQGENTFTFHADESSIVRKVGGQAKWPTSAVTEQDFDDLHSDAPGDRDDYCDCGWPLNLLLPKGDLAGRGFKVMAMVSVGAPSIGPGSCGSRSFCGTDFDGYPELDTINLGFPFDRPAPNGTIDLIARSPNMAMRSITIQHTPDLWSELSQRSQNDPTIT